MMIKIIIWTVNQDYPTQGRVTVSKDLVRRNKQQPGAALVYRRCFATTLPSMNTSDGLLQSTKTKAARHRILTLLV